MSENTMTDDQMRTDVPGDARVQRVQMNLDDIVTVYYRPNAESADRALFEFGHDLVHWLKDRKMKLDIEALGERQSRTFTLDQVFTAVSGQLIGKGTVEDVIEIYNFMGRVQLKSHQIDDALYDITPEMVRQHPWMAGIKLPDPGQDRDAWLEKMREEHGTEITLQIGRAHV